MPGSTTSPDSFTPKFVIPRTVLPASLLQDAKSRLRVARAERPQGNEQQADPASRATSPGNRLVRDGNQPTIRRQNRRNRCSFNRRQQSWFRVGIVPDDNGVVSKHSNGNASAMHQVPAIPNEKPSRPSPSPGYSPKMITRLDMFCSIAPCGPPWTVNSRQRGQKHSSRATRASSSVKIFSTQALYDAGLSHGSSTFHSSILLVGKAGKASRNNKWTSGSIVTIRSKECRSVKRTSLG